MSEEQTWLIDKVAQEDKPTVALVGQDGNAFSVIGRVHRAWQTNRAIDNNREIAEEYTNRAIGGDYNNLLQVTMEYINEKSESTEEE